MADSMNAHLDARRWLDFVVGVGAGVSINLLSSLVEGQSMRIGALTAVLLALAVASLAAPGGWIAARVGPGYCADVVRWAAVGCSAVLLGLDVLVAAGRAAPAEGVSVLLAWWTATCVVVWRLPERVVPRLVKPVALGGMLTFGPMAVAGARELWSGHLWLGGVFGTLAGAVLLGAGGVLGERWWALRLAAVSLTTAILSTAWLLADRGNLAGALAGALLAVSVGLAPSLSTRANRCDGRVGPRVIGVPVVVAFGFALAAALAWREGKPVAASAVLVIAVGALGLAIGHVRGSRWTAAVSLTLLAAGHIGLGSWSLLHGRTLDGASAVALGSVLLMALVTLQTRRGRVLLYGMGLPLGVTIASVLGAAGAIDGASAPAGVIIGACSVGVALTVWLSPRRATVRSWWMNRTASYDAHGGDPDADR